MRGSRSASVQDLPIWLPIYVCVRVYTCDGARVFVRVHVCVRLCDGARVVVVAPEYRICMLIWLLVTSYYI